MLINNTMKKILAIALFLGSTLGNINAQTFTVTTTSGADDNWFNCGGAPPDSDGDATTGSFIEGVARLNNGTATLIEFAIPGAGPHVINLDAGNMNPQLCASNTLINGFTQQDGSGNPDITIIGRNWGVILDVRGSNNVIQGINFIGEVQVTNGGAFNTIQNNYFGTDNTGTSAATLSINGGVNGVVAENASDNNFLNNIISNSSSNPVHIRNNSLRTTINNNLIGFDKTGTVAIPNGGTPLVGNELPDRHGIYIQNGSNFAHIEGNLVGNSVRGSGIYSQNSSSHTIIGNVIGLDSTGLIAMGNYGQGVLIEGGSLTRIGGPSIAERNIISGNGNANLTTPPDQVDRIMGHGIELRTSNNNSVEGNWVGLDITGNGAIGNHLNGIYVQNGSSNTIGGNTSAHANIVGGNGFAHTLNGNPNAANYSRHGIQIDGNFHGANGPSNTNIIRNNWSGLGNDGVSNLGNSEDGISIYRRSISTIVENNTVVYNKEGIFIQTHSDNTSVYGNYVGLLPDGVTAVGNINDGIKIHSGENNIIGGTTAGQENYIVGNGGNGIQLTYGGDEGVGGFPNEAATNNIIQNNIIGHDGSNVSWSNGGAGILINQGSSNNTIGGILTNESNLIANNGGNGIDISGTGSDNNTILGNEIYCNAGRGIELNDEGNDNFASSGSGGSAELFVNTASVAPNFFGIMPTNTSVVHVYEQGTCETCGETDANQVQGARYLGTATLNTGAGTWSFTAPGGVTDITVTATDAGGSTSEFSQCVTICSDPGAATLNVSPSNTICQGETVDFTASAANAGTWQYTFFRGATQVQQSTSPTLTGVSIAGDYTVQIADASFPSNTTCQSPSSPITLTVNSAPTVSGISGASPVCEGDVESYSVTPSTTGTSTYTWTVPTGTTINSGQGNGTISVTWGATAGNITVSETTNQGCTSATPVSQAITVNQLPSTSSINGNNPVCDGDIENYSVTGGLNSTYSWSVPTGSSINSGQGSDQITVDFGGASSGNISVVETTNAGCVAPSATTLAITINPDATLTGISGDDEVCEGDVVTYTSTPSATGTSTYTWTVPTGATINSGQGGGSISVTWGATSGNVTVSETTTAGCTSSTPVTRAVIVNTLPIIAGITGPTPVCDGDIESYDVTSPSATSIYTWTTPTGSTITLGQGSDQITVNWSGANSGNITVSEEDNNGCISSTTADLAVTVNSLPSTPSIAGNATPNCSETGVNYTVTNNPSSTYFWTVPSGATITSGQGSSSILVNFGTNNGDITVIETNTGCSSSTETFPILLQGCLLNADFSANTTTICVGQTVTFTDQSTGTTGSTTYSWDFGTGASPATSTSDGPVIVTYNTAGTATVSLTITDGASDTETKNTYITIVAPPSTSAITGVDNVCDGDIETYTVTGDLNSSYVWAAPTGANIQLGQGSDQITVNWTGASSGNITVTETNNTGCPGTPITLPVTVNPAATVTSIDGPTTVCEGDVTTYSALPSVGTSTYAWAAPAGASIDAGQGSDEITVTWGTTSGDITVSETATGGCTSAAPVTLAVTTNPLPSTTSIVGDDEVCEGDIESYSVTDNLGSSYSWTVPTGATITSGDGTNSITIDYSGASSGTITVAEENSGCTDPSASTLDVTVNPLLGTVGPITAPTGTLCDGSSSTTYNYSILTVDNATGYNWTVPAGATIVTDNGTDIVVDFGTANGSGTVSVEATGLCGTGTDQVDIDVTPTANPEVQITSPKLTGCGNENITIEAFPLNGGSSPIYIWYVNGIEVQNGSDPIYTSTFNDQDSINVIMIGNAECSSDDSVTALNHLTADIQETPTAIAGPDVTLENPETVLLTTTEYQSSTSGSGITYNWSSSVDDFELSLTTTTSLLSIINAKPTEAETWYKLVVTNSIGCSDEDSMLVTIEFKPFIPTGFSPNNDGTNDAFQIHNIEKYPGNHVEVYNRWGSLVFEADDYGITAPLWDGTYNGKDLPMATYYFVVDFNNGSDPQAGPLTIIK